MSTQPHHGSAGRPRQLIVGRYTAVDPVGDAQAGRGLLAASFDAAEGGFSIRTTVLAPEASFLALSRAGDVVYAVLEDERDGRVAAFRLDSRAESAAHPTLTRLGEWPTDGGAPCHLTVHPNGRFLFAANYATGTVAVLQIAPDGTLGKPSGLAQHTGSGPVADRQQGPHAHGTAIDPIGETVLAADLGTDSVYAYRLDEASGSLVLIKQNRLTPGSGPRNLAFHPSGRVFYLVNELDSTISQCAYNVETGTVTARNTFPAVPRHADGTVGGEPNYPSGIVVTPDGARIYWANRGDQSICSTAVDPATGDPVGEAARFSCGGDWPRSLTLTRDGSVLFCANQRSGGVIAFGVDPAAGALEPLSPELPAPGAAHVLELG